MTSRVVEALRSGATSLAALTADLGVHVNRHKEFQNLVQLTYDQIDSPRGDLIVDECRGIILDEAADWRVVAHGFNRFYNDGEGHAAKIDWQNCRVQEKLDGSLSILYRFGGVWHVATRGSPDASGLVGKTQVRFADLFWRASGLSFRRLPHLDPDVTYCFELMTPLNRVVIPHQTEGLALIGARNRVIGVELAVADVGLDIGAPTVREFPLTSLDAVIAAAKALRGIEQEGYVVVGNELQGGSFPRVKVKSPAYVALHHMTDGLSRRRIIELVRLGETPEWLAYWPEYADDVAAVQKQFDRLVAEVEAAYAVATAEAAVAAPEGQQKCFALALRARTGCAAPAFALRAGRVTSIREWFRDCGLEPLERALENVK